MKAFLIFTFIFSLPLSGTAFGQINVADGLQLESDGEILLDDKMYNFTTQGNSKIFFRKQKPSEENGVKYIEGNTIIEFGFDNIDDKDRKLQSLTTIMQIKEGFNVEYKKYEDSYPDKGTFCSDFSGTFTCFTISAYFCSKLYQNLGNKTNALKNKQKIMECYEKVDFLRFFTTIKEDPETKKLKKITEENVAIMKSRLTKHFGSKKTKDAFQTVEFDLLTEGGNNDRVEYFGQLMKTINACENMFRTSAVLQYGETLRSQSPTPKSTGKAE